MLAWTAAQPLWLGLAIFIGIGSLLSTLVILIMNAYVSRAELISNNFVAGFKFTYLAQIFTALIAFMLIEQAHVYNGISASINDEATAIVYLDRTMAELALPGTETVRRRLHDYTKSVIDAEFKTMPQGREHPETAQKLREVFTAYAVLAPQSQSDIMILRQGNRFLSEIEENRVERLVGADHRLNPLIWFTALICLMATTLWSAFFGSNNLLTQISMGILLAVANMTVAFFLLVASHPFLGDLAIDSGPFTEALSQMAAH